MEKRQSFCRPISNFNFDNVNYPISFLEKEWMCFILVQRSNQTFKRVYYSRNFFERIRFKTGRSIFLTWLNQLSKLSNVSTRFRKKRSQTSLSRNVLLPWKWKFHQEIRERNFRLSKQTKPELNIPEFYLQSNRRKRTDRNVILFFVSARRNSATWPFETFFFWFWMKQEKYLSTWKQMFKFNSRQRKISLCTTVASPGTTIRTKWNISSKNRRLSSRRRSIVAFIFFPSLFSRFCRTFIERINKSKGLNF